MPLTLPAYTPEDIGAAIYDIPATVSDQLYGVLQRPDVADVTSKEAGGTGVFDALMETVSAHLGAEYAKGRITGTDYTQAYIALTEAALNSAISFVLGRDQAFWQAQQAQIGAVTGRVQLETARVNHAFTLPQQYALLEAQVAGQQKQNSILDYNLASTLPAQLSLLNEQKEAERAKTVDVRTDSMNVVGLIGKQKDLYSQQVTSYQRDAEVKAAKLWADAWNVQKTIDEGLAPPDKLTNATVDQVFARIQFNNGLVY